MGGSSQSMLLSFNMPPVAKSGMLGFLSGGGGGFSPDDVDDLGAWYDSSDSSTITESSGRVSQWNDKKGSANLVQGTTGSQPLVVENDLNKSEFISGKGDLPNPLCVDIETASICDLGCPHCFRDYIMTPDKIMKQELFEKIIASVVRMEVPSIKLNWRGLILILKR